MIPVSEHDKRLARFPEAEYFQTGLFAEIEQGFIAREIFRGGGQCQIEEFHVGGVCFLCVRSGNFIAWF
jgi:hypothetical protein